MIVKKIQSCYNSNYGEENLTVSGLTGWGNKTMIQMPLTFAQEAALDFYIRCSASSDYEAAWTSSDLSVVAASSDGPAYESRELSLAKASGIRIELAASGASLIVENKCLVLWMQR